MTPGDGHRKKLASRRATLAARTPLRVKLLAAVLALVVIALAIISLAGVELLQNSLLTQEDAKLQQMAAAFPRTPEGSGFSQGPGDVVPQRYVYEFVTTGNTVYPPSIPGSFPRISPTAGWVTSQAPAYRTVMSQSGGQHWRMLAVQFPEPTNVQDRSTGTEITAKTLVVGIDVSSDYATIARLIRIDLTVSVLVLLGIGIAGLALVQASLKSLNEIEETAEAIAAGDLSRRVPETDPRTEVGSLGRSLNAMLAQIEAAFAARTRSEATARQSEERMRRFVADASHELRTPLTTIRGFAEYYRQRGGVDGDDEPGRPRELIDDLATAATTANGRGKLSHAELDRLIKRVEQEAARMGVLVEDLLLLARLDQQRPLEFKTVDLLAIAADSVHDARVIAPRREITLTVETSRIPLVSGDEVRLRQVVGNLMNNALTHTPDGTPIEITISSGDMATAPARNGAPAPVANGAPPIPAAIFRVSDHGPGLTQEQAEHVFERFYRTDRARTRTAGGTGLGLAIVAALIAAHRGRVWVESAAGAGTTFGFALPLSPEALAAEADADHDTGGEATGDTAADPGPGPRPPVPAAPPTPPTIPRDPGQD